MRRFEWLVLATAVMTVSGCALLPTFGAKDDSREQIYTLDPMIRDDVASDTVCQSLAVGDAFGAPGFRTSRMAYSTAPFEIDYFAYARWADAVPRLLRQPLHRAFASHRGFGDVITAPALAPTRFRVEVNDVRLIQRFESRDATQSRVEFDANVRVFSVNPNRVLATQQFTLTRAASGDPASGVEAANRLVSDWIREVVSFTYDACRSSEVS